MTNLFCYVDQKNNHTESFSKKLMVFCFCFLETLILFELCFCFNIFVSEHIDMDPYVLTKPPLQLQSPLNSLIPEFIWHKWVFERFINCFFKFIIKQLAALKITNDFDTSDPVGKVLHLQTAFRYAQSSWPLTFNNLF